MKIQIIPTILAPDFQEFKNKFFKVASNFPLLQIDCADGRFVKNKTFYEVKKIRSLSAFGGKSKVSYELHLMVKEPLKEIKKWLGFKKVKRIIFHYEAVKSDQERLKIIKYLHQHKIQAGLAINPETKVNQFISLLPQVDYLLFLGVNPGWGGQKLQLSVLNKIKKVRKMLPKLLIGLDGGINLKNLKNVVLAGANVLAIGSLFFADSDISVIKAKIKSILAV